LDGAEVTLGWSESLRVRALIGFDPRSGPLPGDHFVRGAIDGQFGRIRQRGDQLLREAIALGGCQVTGPREHFGKGRDDGPLTGLAAGRRGEYPREEPSKRPDKRLLERFRNCVGIPAGTAMSAPLSTDVREGRYGQADPPGQRHER
jgi:hypothetical protein